MMRSYLTNITPDGMSGLIFGLEGITDGIVLLNGPSGCKFYHSATSDNQFIRQLEFDPLNYPERWYFGQPRVPCTSLDNGDYVYGSESKLREALTFLRENVKFEILFVVNSPGAALIGDDIRRIAETEIVDRPVITYETPGFSENICKGYVKAGKKLVGQVVKDAGGITEKRTKSCFGDSVKKPVVNVIGLNLFRRHSFGDVLEIKKILNLIGAEAGCFLMAGCSCREVEEMGKADLNLVLFPEFGLPVAEALKEKCGTEYFVPETPPIGFKATEEFAVSLGEILSISPERLLAESEMMRARTYPFISRLNSITGMPKGRPFAIEAHRSEAMGYARFLIEYFAMTADSVSVLDKECDCGGGDLAGMLHSYGMDAALRCDIMDTEADIVMANGNTIAALKLKRKKFGGIDITLPGLGYVDILPKTHLGVKGAALLSELIINGLVY